MQASTKQHAVTPPPATLFAQRIQDFEAGLRSGRKVEVLALRYIIPGRTNSTWLWMIQASSTYHARKNSRMTAINTAKGWSVVEVGPSPYWLRRIVFERRS